MADPSWTVRLFDESFDQTFPKVSAVEVAETSSPSAEGETPFAALFFCKLFFCAYMVKRKATNRFVLFDELLLLQRDLLGT